MAITESTTTWFRKNLLKSALVEVFKFCVLPALAAIGSIFEDISESYSRQLFFGTLFLVSILGAFDCWRTFKFGGFKILFLYVFSIVVFFTCSLLLSSELKSTNLPIVIWLLLIILSRLTVMTEIGKAEQVHGFGGDAGLASAGVLVLTEAEHPVRFVLIRNRNLRGGKGLWVPPGGHVVLAGNRPERQLLDKVLSETGFSANLLETHTDLMPADQSAWSTKACTWLHPPAFLLIEDLMGTCSRGHTSHVDFCYICLASGSATNPTPRYGQNEQITVKVSDCIESLGATRSAVLAATEGLNKAISGKPHGLSDDVTEDVVWRLHLSAIYLQKKGVLNV
jgi:hypothetical protein